MNVATSISAIERWQSAGFGIYVHWPFCAAKCPYCDFNSHVAPSIDQNAWEQAYLAEIARYGAELGGRVVSSIFFGGGTPSLMEPRLVEQIVGTIAEAWDLSNDVEITLEANPTSVEASKFQGFRAAGINRVSVGVQSLNDPDLGALGREHSAKEARRAIDIAQQSFDHASFDLIYARQSQSLSAWEAELRDALALDPTHLSLYQLTIEDGTPFAYRHRRGQLPGLPDEDLAADMYLATQEICSSAGLPAYEVSNHARPGAESRHNLIYWRSGDYAGIGPGAHGRLTMNGTRLATETLRAPALWLAQALEGQGEANRVPLTAQQVAQETLLMGLRLREGIQVEEETKAALDPIGLQTCVDLGYLENTGWHLTVTDLGRPLLNAILREIVLEE